MAPQDEAALPEAATSMIYPLAPNGIFWTLQGEGQLAGEPMAFIRLAGCSVNCPACDTDYSVARRLSVEDICAEVKSVVPAPFRGAWVWITGGEPLIHPLQSLCDALHLHGYRVALATSGSITVPRTLDLQWISISPHDAELTQRNGHELKIVPELNGLTWADVEQLGTHSFPYRFIQPLWGSAGPVNLAACISFVAQTPGWRLTAQQHKVWGLP